MSETRECPVCGCEMPANVLLGMCPRCLLKAALEQPSVMAGTDTGPAPRPASNGFVPPSPQQLANVIPQIEILELVAAGGMGAVYKGRQKSLDRLVAVKILPPDIGHDATFAERFNREARALGRLNHPNIVAIHDSGQSNGLYYFVMEYVDGTNLRHLLKEKSLSPKDALAIVPQICEALQFAHDAGIMHRDIKPENILIDRRGRVKIADFGLAKILGQEHLDDNLTATRQVMGTVKYMAPEQMEGARHIDHRADIYSLGVVFYELLTGELPLGRFPLPSKKVQIDVRLDEIVLRTLEKEPNQRYQHAGDVKTEVESVVRTPFATHEPGAEPSRTDEPLLQSVSSAFKRLSQRIRAFAGKIDAIDRPYARCVWFPLIGFAVFCAVGTTIVSLNEWHSSPEDMLLLNLVWDGGAFLVLNAFWYLRKLVGAVEGPIAGPWSTEQTIEQVGRAARRLRLTSILTFLSWPLMALLTETPTLSFTWIVTAGTILWMAGRAIAKQRDPGTFPLVVAMAPLTPAVVVGLPVGLRTLRMLERPEVKELFEARARAKPSVRAAEYV